MTANQIARVDAMTRRDQAAEQKRHNLITEAQGERDVASNELYRDRSGRAALSQAAASHRQAGASESQARTAAQRAVEDARHNLASEAISQMEAETHRHQADTQRSAAEETHRNNMARLGFDLGKSISDRQETRRHNRASEEAAQTSAQGALYRGQAAADRVRAQNTLDYIRSADFIVDDVLDILNMIDSDKQKGGIR